MHAEPRITDAKSFNCWAHIFKSEDVPGQWLAHCLDFDIVTQGDSVEHAAEMIEDAVGITLVDDIDKGFDPQARRAPDEEWSQLNAILEHGTYAPPSEAFGVAKVHPIEVAYSFSLRLVRTAVVHEFSRGPVPPVAHYPQPEAA